MLSVVAQADAVVKRGEWLLTENDAGGPCTSSPAPRSTLLKQMDAPQCIGVARLASRMDEQ
jgi:hypothetical protein